jgi:HAD superfamily hydrolase (TIGR01509 family)
VPRGHIVGSPPGSKLSSPQAILFDFGGTLDADGVTWKARVRRLFQDEGVAPAAGDFDRVFYAVDDVLTGTIPSSLSFQATLARLATGVASGLGVRDAAVGDRVARRFLEAALAHLRGQAPLLDRLRARHALGVVSNFYGNLEAVCAEAGIAQFFRVLIDSSRVGWRKPDPRIFQAALEPLRVAPAQALFVGDSLPRDMAGARALGMPHIWLAPAIAPPDGPCCPGDRIVRALADLEGILP